MIGLTAVLLSSKLEDVKPIYMSQVVADAGHNKFSKALVLEKEMEIFEALEFRFDHRTAYEEACVKVKQAMFLNQKMQLSNDDSEKLFSFISFLAHIAAHSLFLSTCIEVNNLGIVMLLLSLRYLRRSHESFDMPVVDEDEDANMGEETPALGSIKLLIKYFKGMLLLDYDESQYKKAKQVLITEFDNYLLEKFGLKNLFKFFPDFLSQETYLLVATSHQMSIPLVKKKISYS